jgi:serine protease inhibitor ecotin
MGHPGITQTVNKECNQHVYIWVQAWMGHSGISQTANMECNQHVYIWLQALLGHSRITQTANMECNQHVAGFILGWVTPELLKQQTLNINSM